MVKNTNYISFIMAVQDLRIKFTELSIYCSHFMLGWKVEYKK